MKAVATGTKNATDVRPTLITGGAGFVGANLAHRLLSAGRPVLVFDNLSRPGVERNLAWLRERHPAGLEATIADVRDAKAVARAVARARQVFHFAAQVAVTTSLVDPRHDFEINALGTLNVLEAIRAQAEPPPVVITSTNKVYGGLEDIAIGVAGQHYAPEVAAIAEHGIAEDRPLDFHSPYGCSKGTADQYVRDYARSYGLRTVVFRMSCIYGQRQFGTEDQGWVAHFLLRAIDGKPITVYGDGRQVRDVLYVDDLVDAFLLAERDIDRIAGRAFNIGGGPRNVVSLLDLLGRIEQLDGRRPVVSFADWRTGDQRWYVSDPRRFAAATGWTPRIDAQQGIERLYRWLRELRAGERAARAQRIEPRVATAAHALARAGGGS